MNRTVQLLRLATLAMSAVMVAVRLKQMLDDSRRTARAAEREGGGRGGK